MVTTENITDNISLSDGVNSVKAKTAQITDAVVIAGADAPRVVPAMGIHESVIIFDGVGGIPHVSHRARVIYNFPTTINGMPVKLTTFNLTRRLSQIPTLRATLPKGTHAELGDMVRISWDDGAGNVFQIFSGIITEIDTPERSSTVDIIAEGVETILAKDIFAEVDAESGTINGVFAYDDTRADVIAEQILNGTGFYLVECPTDPVTLKFDFTPRWKALGLLADILNVDLWVDDTGGVHLGLKHGSVDLYDAIYKVVHRTDIKNKVNRVIVVGGVSPDGNVPIGVAQDGTDISNYYPMTTIKKFPQIQDVGTATKLAKVYLARFNRETRELELTLAINPRNVRLRDGDNITVDGEPYKISRIVLTPKNIRVSATPSVAVPELTSYLRNATQQTTENAVSSDFESSTPVAFTLYENIELAPDPDGDGTAETVEVDGDTYTILGVMNFYVPENFTAESVTLYARQYSPTIEEFGVVINGEWTAKEVTTADDGMNEYKFTITPDQIKAGWNKLYFVDVSP